MMRPDHMCNSQCVPPNRHAYLVLVDAPIDKAAFLDHNSAAYHLRWHWRILDVYPAREVDVVQVIMQKRASGCVPLYSRIAQPEEANQWHPWVVLYEDLDRCPI